MPLPMFSVPPLNVMLWYVPAVIDVAPDTVTFVFGRPLLHWADVGAARDANGSLGRTWLLTTSVQLPEHVRPLMSGAVIVPLLLMSPPAVTLHVVPVSAPTG